HRVGEPGAALEVALVAEQVVAVLVEGHLTRPAAAGEARRLADVLHRRRPGRVVGVVVLRAERLQPELWRGQAGGRVEVLWHEVGHQELIAAPRASCLRYSGPHS